MQPQLEKMDKRLVRISAVSIDEEPDIAGTFWTMMGFVTNEDGSFKSAVEIQGLLALPELPATAIIGGLPAVGTNMLIGGVANSTGAALQVITPDGIGISAPSSSVVKKLHEERS